MNNGIIVDKNVSNLDAERGNLLGTRFALFNELKDGDKLKTNEVQLLSGGDKIPATPKYKDPMNIEPHFLCLLTTNHMPELSVLIAAIMERMLCIHFQVFYTNLEPGEVPTLCQSPSFLDSAEAGGGRGHVQYHYILPRRSQGTLSALPWRSPGAPSAPLGAPSALPRRSLGAPSALPRRSPGAPLALPWRSQGTLSALPWRSLALPGAPKAPSRRSPGAPWRSLALPRHPLDAPLEFPWRSLGVGWGGGVSG